MASIIPKEIIDIIKKIIPEKYKRNKEEVDERPQIELPLYDDYYHEESEKKKEEDKKIEIQL